MSMMLTISIDLGFLRVNTTGNFSLAEAKRTFIEILEAVGRSKIEKVLFDGRGIAGDPEVMERFYYGEFAAETIHRFTAQGVSSNTRFAYVLEEPMRDPERFGENVAVNRGMFVQTFDNDQDALAWLRMSPADKPAAGHTK
jgi:hypothetical protein